MIEEYRLVMADKKIGKDWEEFAKGDWAELLTHIHTTYASTAKRDLIDEFAKQAHIEKHALDILTNIAAGKAVGIVSAPASLTLDCLDLFTQSAGLIWYWSNPNTSARTRLNPHNMWKQEFFSDKWYYSSASLKDYVKFMLYCYPDDRKNGYRGFRFGSIKGQEGVLTPLPKAKK